MDVGQRLGKVGSGVSIKGTFVVDAAGQRYRKEDDAKALREYKAEGQQQHPSCCLFYMYETMLSFLYYAMDLEAITAV